MQKNSQNQQLILITHDILYRGTAFQEYVSEGITHPVFYGDLVYKNRRVKGEANFV